MKPPPFWCANRSAPRATLSCIPNRSQEGLRPGSRRSSTSRALWRCRRAKRRRAERRAAAADAADEAAAAQNADAQADAGSLPIPTTSFWAAPTPKSLPTRTATTNARAWVDSAGAAARGGPGGRGAGRGGGGRCGTRRARRQPRPITGAAQPRPGADGGGFGGGRGYSLVDTTLPGADGKQESGVFEGIDTSLTSIAQYAGAESAARAHRCVSPPSWPTPKPRRRPSPMATTPRTAAPVEAGLTAIRALARAARLHGLSDAARYEVDFRLKWKERDYRGCRPRRARRHLRRACRRRPRHRRPAGAAHLDRGESRRPEVSVTGVDIAGFDGAAACAAGAAKKDATYTCSLRGARSEGRQAHYALLP